MKKTFSLLLIIIALVGGYVGYRLSHSTNGNTVKQVQQKVSVSESPTVEPTIAYAAPKTLRIPKITVDAAIESVGQDTKRAMDVPKNSDNVGWYDLGVKPGEKGNAVMDGHLDKVTGAPAVFWNVAKLKVGDKIIVEDVNGKSLTFSVTKTTKYPYDNFPLQEVFGPTDKHMLNLISCNGVWDAKTHNYSQRTVVYSELVE